jgi:hypothetical protein
MLECFVALVTSGALPIRQSPEVNGMLELAFLHSADLLLRQ